MKILRLAFVSILLSTLASTLASAACPVGKQIGDTWCANGYKWKCEKCGSEYCEIMQPGRCYRDDARYDASDISRLTTRVMVAPRNVPAYSPRQ
jgi:hypothetical protein